MIKYLELIENILDLFLSNDYFNIWKELLENNTILYNNNKDIDCDYTHIQYDIYNEYNNLIENQLEKCCMKYNISIKEFYFICKELNNTNNVIVDVFCTLILSLTEIEIFNDIISNIEKRQYFYHIIESWRGTLRSDRK